MLPATANRKVATVTTPDFGFTVGGDGSDSGRGTSEDQKQVDVEQVDEEAHVPAPIITEDEPLPGMHTDTTWTPSLLLNCLDESVPSSLCLHFVPHFSSESCNALSREMFCCEIAQRL